MGASLCWLCQIQGDIAPVLYGSQIIRSTGSRVESEPGMVIHFCHLRIKKTETGELLVSGQPELYRESLSQNTNPKKKKKANQSFYHHGTSLPVCKLGTVEPLQTYYLVMFVYLVGSFVF